MRLEGELPGGGTARLSDVALSLGPEALEDLARLAGEARRVAGEVPAPGGPWPPVVEVGEAHGLSLVVDLSGRAAEADALRRLSELALDPPWLQGDVAEGAAPYGAAAFPPDSGALGDSLRDGLRMAAPGLDVCEWWDWVPPGVCLYVDLPVPPARGVEEALTLYVLVSALCPYCCVFCQRSLSVPSAETLVRDLVDADAVRAAADAVGGGPRGPGLSQARPATGAAPGRPVEPQPRPRRPVHPARRALRPLRRALRHPKGHEQVRLRPLGEALSGPPGADGPGPVGMRREALVSPGGVGRDRLGREMTWYSLPRRRWGGGPARSRANGPATRVPEARPPVRSPRRRSSFRRRRTADRLRPSPGKAEGRLLPATRRRRCEAPSRPSNGCRNRSIPFPFV